MEDIDIVINIEGTEAFVPPAPSVDYIEGLENLEGNDEEIDIEFDELPMEDLQKELELEDFNDEH